MNLQHRIGHAEFCEAKWHHRNCSIDKVIKLQCCNESTNMNMCTWSVISGWALCFLCGIGYPCESERNHFRWAWLPTRARAYCALPVLQISEISIAIFLSWNPEVMNLRLEIHQGHLSWPGRLCTTVRTVVLVHIPGICGAPKEQYSVRWPSLQATPPEPGSRTEGHDYLEKRLSVSLVCTSSVSYLLGFTIY